MVPSSEPEKSIFPGSTAGAEEEEGGWGGEVEEEVELGLEEERREEVEDHSGS